MRETYIEMEIAVTHQAHKQTKVEEENTREEAPKISVSFTESMSADNENAATLFLSLSIDIEY